MPAGLADIRNRAYPRVLLDFDRGRSVALHHGNIGHPPLHHESEHGTAHLLWQPGMPHG